MTTRLLRLLAVLTCLALLAAACGGDDDAGDVAADTDDSEQVDGDRSGDDGDAGLGGADGEGDGGEGAGSDGDVVEGGPAVGSAAGGDSTGAGAGGAPGTGGGGDGGEEPAALQPTAPGTYHITVDGTSTVGTQSEEMADRTLEVRPPEDRRQVQVTTADDGSSRTELHMQFADDGVRLNRVSISQQGLAKTFRFSPPVLAAPATAQVGQKWSWSGTSDDGETTLDAAFEVLETGVPVTVGGEQVSTVKLRSVIKTSGDLESTSTDVQWVSPEHRLIVKTEGSSNGRFGPFTFESQYTWKLDSLKPS